MININEIQQNSSKDELLDITQIEGYVGICLYIEPDGDCKNSWIDTTTSEWAAYASNPEFIYNAFDVKMNSFSFLPNSLGAEIEFEVTYTFYELDPWLRFEPVYNWYAPLCFEVFLNGEQIFSYSSFEEADEENKWFYYDDSIIFNLTLDDIDLEQDLNFQFYFKNESNSEYWAEYEFEKQISVSIQEYSEYEVNLSTQFETKTIYVPIVYDYVLNEFVFEEYQFTMLSPGITLYPTETSEILLFNYKDNLSSSIPITLSKVDIFVNMEGYEEHFKFNAEWLKTENDEYVLQVNDSMYYDDNEQLMYSGSSNTHQTFNDKLILPLDYAENYGNLKFTLNFSQYNNIAINFTIPIGSFYGYRGNKENSLFYVEYVEYQQNEVTYNKCYSFEIYDYLSNGGLNEEWTIC